MMLEAVVAGAVAEREEEVVTLVVPGAKEGGVFGGGEEDFDAFVRHSGDLTGLTRLTGFRSNLWRFERLIHPEFPFELEARRAKVDQKPNVEVRRRQIIHKLHLMR